MYAHTLRVVAVAAALVCFCQAGAASSGEQQAAATGLVVSVSGEVVIERAGGQELAGEGLVLYGGDTIVVKPGARCTGFTPMGESFEIAGPAELRLPESAEEGILSSIAGWVRLQLSEWIGESRRQALTTRSVRDWQVAVDAPAPLIPAPEGQVRANKPRFLWTVVPGIDRHVVTLAPASGEEVSKIVRGYQTIIDDLAPGEEYVWKVHPSVEEWEGESRWRSFRVMDPGEEQQLDAALRDMEDLEAGVLLLSAGLHEEAVYRFDAAVSSGMDDRSARLWRAQALAEIGLYKQAYEDLVQSRPQE
jgi:hypothetical protein